MDAKIQNWMEKKNVPGIAACIVKGNKITWSKGYGMANLARKIPFTPDQSLFQIASITKTITATAIMQLRDKGHFMLDDDVSRFLEFPVRNPKYPEEPITFRHLLTHTSSINDSDAIYELYAAGDPTASLEHVVTQYFTKKGTLWNRENFAKKAPGRKERYSNTGFALLGLLVEKISKQSLEDYLQQHVYGILNMTDTSFYIATLGRERQACAYTHVRKVKDEICPGDGDGNLLPEGASAKVGYNEHALYSYPTLADGMVRTSVNQLANFMIAMMNGGRFDGGQLLRQETVDEMLSGEEQGLSWFRSGNYWGHDGGDPGCSTEMQFDPERKIGFIIFANADAKLKKVKALLRAKAEGTET